MREVPLRDIQSAAASIYGVVTRTPLIRMPLPDGIARRLEGVETTEGAAACAVAAALTRPVRGRIVAIVSGEYRPHDIRFSGRSVLKRCRIQDANADT